MLNIKKQLLMGVGMRDEYTPGETKYVTLGNEGFLYTARLPFRFRTLV